MHIKKSHVKGMNFKVGVLFPLTIFLLLPFINVDSQLKVGVKNSVSASHILSETFSIQREYLNSFDYKTFLESYYNQDIEQEELPKTEEEPVTLKSTNNIASKISLSLEQKILKRNDKIGSAGRLYFPSLYSVALYNTSLYDRNIQNIVDRSDSAAYFRYGSVYLIGDHNDQGFNIIKSQKVGSKAYIKLKKSNGSYYLRTFKVVEVINGYNYGDHLVTKDGRDVKDINASLVMYTCNTPDGRNVTIVIYEDINAKKTTSQKVVTKVEEKKPEVNTEVKEVTELPKEENVEMPKEEKVDPVEPKEEKEEIKEEVEAPTDSTDTIDDEEKED